MARTRKQTAAKAFPELAAAVEAAAVKTETVTEEITVTPTSEGGNAPSFDDFNAAVDAAMEIAATDSGRELNLSAALYGVRAVLPHGLAGFIQSRTWKKNKLVSPRALHGAFLEEHNPHFKANVVAAKLKVTATDRDEANKQEDAVKAAAAAVSAALKMMRSASRLRSILRQWKRNASQ